MGGAIPVMHYTGMAAVSFTPWAYIGELAHSVEISSLGIVGIGGITLLVLVLAILTPLVHVLETAISPVRQSDVHVLRTSMPSERHFA
jgi:Bacterial signalling protein N terminal repeat